jgi:hypothetical protein
MSVKAKEIKEDINKRRTGKDIKKKIRDISKRKGG